MLFDECSWQNSKFTPQRNFNEQNSSKKSHSVSCTISFFCLYFPVRKCQSHQHCLLKPWLLANFFLNNEIWSIFQCVMFLCATMANTSILCIFHNKANSYVQTSCTFEIYQILDPIFQQTSMSGFRETISKLKTQCLPFSIAESTRKCLHSSKSSCKLSFSVSPSTYLLSILSLPF